MALTPHRRLSDDGKRRLLLAVDPTTGLVVESDAELEAAWGLPGDLKGLPVKTLFGQQTAREAVLRYAVSEFLFTAVHDLNSPLRNVGLMIGILRSELGCQCPPGTVELLDNLERAAQRAAQLTERLRAYAEAVAATPAIASGVDLREVWEQAAESVRLRNHAAVNVVVRGSPALAKCDQDLTRLALEKLLENSVRFRGETPLEVRLEAERVDACWELAVCDNGRGVDPEDAPRLFRPFRRLQAEGLGLGLAIAQALVTLQDGRLSLDTAYKGGARFVVALPAA